MVEKTGHKKMMQAARMEWINERKPRSLVHEDSLFDEPALPQRETGNREQTASRVAPIFEKSATERPKTPAPSAEANVENDLYDATPRPTRQQPAEAATPQTISVSGGQRIFGPAKTVAPNDAPPEDDLDALLAEEEALQAASGNVQPATAAKKVLQVEPNFDDEMEAMAEMDMDGIW
jgi:replication fork protection complex subunit Csm3/Swi3